MLNKEDRLRQIKQVLIKFLPVVKENFPWLDITDLHVGRFNDWDTAPIARRLTLYFQPATDAAGNLVTDWREAKYYHEIYTQVGPTLIASHLDEQITYVAGGTWSTMKDVPGWTPAPYIRYYGIRISINFNDFKEGDSVRIKKDWLAPGADPNLIYRVTNVSNGGKITVLSMSKSQNGQYGFWIWPDYTLYKI